MRDSVVGLVGMGEVDGSGAPLRAVVLDGMGVLYRHGDVLGRVLLPYLRAQGCRLPEAEIRTAYRTATAGRMSTSDLWGAFGLTGDGRDEEYCQRHELTPGVIDGLVALAARGLQLACLSNDMLDWSRRLRARFTLDRYIPDWFISSELGVRKPDPLPYHLVLQSLRLPPEQVLFVDDSPANLLTARRVGMRTALFSNDGARPGAEPDNRALDCSALDNPAPGDSTLDEGPAPRDLTLDERALDERAATRLRVSTMAELLAQVASGPAAP